VHSFFFDVEQRNAEVVFVDGPLADFVDDWPNVSGTEVRAGARNEITIEFRDEERDCEV
jgi:hypothetical protein